MKIHNPTLIASACLLMFSTGCTGMSNFLFGRGARCGSCLSLPRLGGGKLGSCLTRPGASTCGPAVAPPAIYQPVASVATPPVCQTPVCQTPVCQAPVCQAPTYDSPAYGVPSCPSCGTGEVISSYGSFDCGCGGHSSYAPPVVSDPYLSSPPVVNSIPSVGQIYEQPGYPVSPTYNGSVGSPSIDPLPDNFQSAPLQRSNRFDTDGARILHVDPLPPGVTAAN